MAHIFFLEDEFAGKDGDNGTGLLDKGHDSDFACGIGIGDEERSVCNNEHYGQQPYPFVANGSFDADVFSDCKRIYDIEETEKEHIPELKPL